MSALQDSTRALVGSVQVGIVVHFVFLLSHLNHSAPHLTVSLTVSPNYRIKVTIITLNLTEVSVYYTKHPLLVYIVVSILYQRIL